MHSVGVMIFVESRRPPRPTSMTIASHSASLNATNARVLVNSKNVAGTEFFSHIENNCGNRL